MNKFSFLLIFSFLSSCQYISYNQLIPLARQALVGLPDIELSEDFISKQEFSFARVDLGKGANIIMVLHKIDGNFYTWISGTGEKVITYSGKIVRTEGLVHNVEIFNPDKFKTLPIGNYAGIFDVMFQDPQAFVEQEFSSKLMEGEDNLLIHEENIIIKILDFSYTNLYWIEKKRGKVIKSQQFVHPKLPILTIDFIYKY